MAPFASPMSDFMLGIWMIIFVAVIWAASSVLLQYVFEDMDFKSPFLVTYVENSCFLIYLPLFYLYRSLGFVKTVPLRQVDTVSKSMQRLIRLNERDACRNALMEEEGEEEVNTDQNFRDSPSKSSPLSTPTSTMMTSRPSSSSSSSSDIDMESFKAADMHIDNIIDVHSNGSRGSSSSRNSHIYHRDSPTNLSRRSTHSSNNYSDDVDGSDNGFASDSSDTSSVDEFRSISHEQIFRIALIICPIWFVANCLYNYSLLMTTVSSSTIISNLAGPFTLVFSWIAGVEQSSWTKWLGIVIGLLGVLLVAYADDNDANAGIHNGSHVLGDLVALIASAGYGLYTTVLKVQVPDDNATLMQLLLGYLGLINAIILLPLLVIMIMIGGIDLEKLTLTVFSYLLLGGVVDNALSDYLWARSVVLTSPTVATVGLGLTIPLAMISDALLGKEYPTVLESLGALLVLAGFVVVSVHSETDDSDNNFNKSHSESSKEKTKSYSMHEIGNIMQKKARDCMFASAAAAAEEKDKHSNDIEMVDVSKRSNPFANSNSIRGQSNAKEYGKLPLSADVIN